MTKVEMIRAVKALQTQAIVQRAAVGGLMDEAQGADSMLHAQLADAQITAQNHIHALQHAIDQLTAKPAE